MDSFSASARNGTVKMETVDFVERVKPLKKKKKKRTSHHLKLAHQLSLKFKEVRKLKGQSS